MVFYHKNTSISQCRYILYNQFCGFFQTHRRIHRQLIVSGIAPAFAGDMPVIGGSGLVGAEDNGESR